MSGSVRSVAVGVPVNAVTSDPNIINDIRHVKVEVSTYHELESLPCANALPDYFNVRAVGPVFRLRTRSNSSPIYCAGTTLLLDAWGGTQYITNGSPVKLYAHDGGPATNELWTFGFDGSISTTSSNGLLCLDSAHTESSYASNQLIVFACASWRPNQRWTWHDNGLIENTGTGYCLDISVNRVGKANQLALAPCNTNANSQLFSQHPAILPTAPIPIYAYGTTLMLDAWGGTQYITNGSPVKLNAHDNSPETNELWTFGFDGSISTTSSNGLLCLDSAHIKSSYASNQLIVFACDSSYPNQRWVWRADNHIENTGTGYCLDASGVGKGNQLSVAPCNRNANSQQFLQRPM